MPITSKKIDKKLKRKNLTRYKLSKLIDKDEGYINHVFRGDQPFSENMIKKLLPILEVTREEFESWLLADKYPKKLLELAINNKKEFPYKRRSLLSTKIDAVLHEKGMSRTALSKEIKYSQSGLNRMIIGKINMSKPVIENISIALNISRDEILSWIIADKYNLKLLELALSYL